MDSNIESIKVKVSLDYTIELHEIQDEADRLFGPGTEVDDDLMNKIAKRLVSKRLDNQLDVRNVEVGDFNYDIEREYKIKHSQG